MKLCCFLWKSLISESWEPPRWGSDHSLPKPITDSPKFSEMKLQKNNGKCWIWLTWASVRWNSLGKLNGCAESGSIILRNGSPCTTILGIVAINMNHHAMYMQIISSFIILHWSERFASAPVVCTVRWLFHRSVHLILNQPDERRVSEEPDVLTVLFSHVSTSCIEVPEEHHILARWQKKQGLRFDLKILCSYYNIGNPSSHLNFPSRSNIYKDVVKFINLFGGICRSGVLRNQDKLLGNC